METKKRKRNDTLENEIKNLVYIDKLFEERQTVEHKIQKYQDEINGILEKFIALEDERNRLCTEISLLEKTPMIANKDEGKDTLTEFLVANNMRNRSLLWGELRHMYSMYCHQNTCKMMSLRSKKAQNILGMFHIFVTWS